jgi:hypothetical protein
MLYIIGTFWIFYGNLVYILQGNLEYFGVIWYVYALKIWQPWKKSRVKKPCGVRLRACGLIDFSLLSQFVLSERFARTAKKISTYICIYIPTSRKKDSSPQKNSANLAVLISKIILWFLSESNLDKHKNRQIFFCIIFSLRQISYLPKESSSLGMVWSH